MTTTESEGGYKDGSAYGELSKKFPDLYPEFAAVRTIKSPYEINKFFAEYTALFEGDSAEAKKQMLGVISSELETGEIDESTANLWKDTLRLE